MVPRPARPHRASPDPKAPIHRPRSPTRPQAPRQAPLPRHLRTLLPPGRRHPGPPRRQERHSRHSRRQRQEHVLQPAHHRGADARPRRSRTLPVSHQDPRPGPAQQALRPRARKRRPITRHLRRRHPRPRQGIRPTLVPHRHIQPRHAPPRHPAQPSLLVSHPPRTQVHRARRGTRVPGRLRNPRRQRHTPAPKDLPDDRQQPPVHPLLGHHRQPRRARRAPGRPAFRGRRRRRHPPTAARTSPSGTRP